MKPVTVNFLNRYHKNKTIEANKLAYLAGLIDGEGYVKVEKWGVVRLIIGMTNKKVIRWIYDNFGGTLKTDQLTCTGKPFYVWRLNNSLENLKLGILVYPYLIVKKKKVLQTLQFLQKRLLKNKDFHTLKGLKL